NCFDSDHQLMLAPMDLALGPLRTLEAIARHGSFSRAARELNLTQPAVSMQVAQLERRLGLPLLERVGKRAFPTRAGPALLAPAGAALAPARRHPRRRAGRAPADPLRPRQHGAARDRRVVRAGAGDRARGDGARQHGGDEEVRRGGARAVGHLRVLGEGRRRGPAARRHAARAVADPAARPRSPPRQAGGAAARRVPGRPRGSPRDAGAAAVDSGAVQATALGRRAFLGGAITALVVTRALAQPAPPSGGPMDGKLIDDLVAANRILADQGVVDGYGHVSVRHPADPQRYLMSRSIAPELVTAADVMEYDLDSSAVDARGRTSYLERFIHGEIYRARPDVRAVVHNHSP